MRTNESYTDRQITRFQDGEYHVVEDHLAAEEPLEINLIYGRAAERKRHRLAVTMRTPGNDYPLALGFLFTEGIIDRRDEVLAIERPLPPKEPQALNIIDIHLAPATRPDIQRLQRNFYTSSSCGVCGKSSIEMVEQHISYVLRPDWPQISAQVLCHLPEKINSAQRLFSLTGGIHAASLFTTEGNLLACMEDVGRHNAMDKLLGNRFREQRIPLDDQVVLLSGRASFELVQKALMAGVPILAAVGAPSTLAVELADTYGMTLIGFVREKGFNVYCGEGRVVVP